MLSEREISRPFTEINADKPMVSSSVRRSSSAARGFFDPGTSRTMGFTGGNVRKSFILLVSVLVGFLLAASLAFAQPNTDKKSYLFKGTVTDVDAAMNKLVVANDNIPGWMTAMTMNYQVDDPAVLKKLKKGDRIEATVYEGDLKLYKVRVVGPAKK